MDFFGPWNEKNTFLGHHVPCITVVHVAYARRQPENPANIADILEP